MKRYSFTHLADQSVLSEYNAIESRENADTATALALLGEIDARKLYVPAGYPSMYAYCLHARHMSEDRAYKRIRVARAAREFPAIYEAIAAGRVHLSALFLLAPHLTSETVDRLLTAAVHKSKSQVELLLAEYFPKPDFPALVQPVRATGGADATAARAEQQEHQCQLAGELPPAPGRVVPTDVPGAQVPLQRPAAQSAPATPRANLAPLSVERFGVQFTMDKAMHDQLRYVQSLLGPTMPRHDIARVFALALECLKDKLEKQKFGKCAHPREARGSKNARHVPDEVKREVWKRDGGQCTFVGEGGKRCDALDSLEFDHVDPVARGGRSTVAGVRLLCAAHNQYAAECVFGVDFMMGKRESARNSAGHMMEPG